jgi:hypothetical protein
MLESFDGLTNISGICKERDSQMTTGIIIGIAIGCSVVLVIVSVLFGFRMCCKRPRKNR